MVVVDGMSDDGTRDVVEKFREKYPNLIDMYQNPGEWQAIGRNIAIRSEKRGDIAYIDGHCVAAESWLRTLHDSLKASGESVAGVGSVHASPKDDSLLGKGIEQVFSTFVGGGASSFRSVKEKREVITAPFVLYRREAVEEVGLYDEDMKYGEDFTLNHKLRRAGHKLIVDPEAVVYYRKRRTIPSFFAQMYNYGVAKAIAGRKYPSSLTFFHVAPSALLVFIITLGVLSFFIVGLGLLLTLAASSYLILIVSTALFKAYEKRDVLFIGLMPILYIIEHFAYSVGFLRGLFKKGWKRSKSTC